MKDKDYTGIEELGPEPVVPGKYSGQYYLRNVATGLWMAQGTLSWGTRGFGDNVGLLFELITSTTGTPGYHIKNLNASGDCYLSFPTIYIDNGDAENAERVYTVTETLNGCLIHSNKEGVEYYLGINPVNKEIDFSPTDNFDNYLWDLVTVSEREAELTCATPICPIDASFMMKNPKFYRNSKNLDADWSITKGSKAGYEINTWFDNENPGHNHNFFLRLYNTTGSTSSARTWKATATVNNLPNGKYTVSFDMLNGSGNLTAVKINNTDYSIPNNTATNLSYAEAIDALVANPDGYRFKFENIEVSNGTLTMVFDKSSNSSATATYFDNFQLIYHGPATVDLDALKDDYAKIYNEADNLKNQKMHVDTKTALESKMIAPETLTTEQAILDAADELNTAIADAKQSIDDYKVMKANLDKRVQMAKTNNVYTTAAYDAFITQPFAAYENNTLVGPIPDPYAHAPWHEIVDQNAFLMSAFGYGGGYDQALYINNWSTEGDNDGSNYTVTFYEYWVDNGNKLGANSWTATQTGLDANTSYTVTALVRVRLQDGQSGPHGITFKVGDGEAVNVCEGVNVENTPFYIATVNASGQTDANGNLNINFIIAEDNNISWLSFKNLRYLKPNNFVLVSQQTDEANCYSVDNNGNYVAKHIILTDAFTYLNDKDIQAEKVSYSRNFGHNQWQAFYLPIDIAVTDFEQFVDKNDEAKAKILEFSSIEDGYAVFTYLADNAGLMLHANTPYIVKPTSNGVINFEFENATVRAAEENAVTSKGWSLQGNYIPVAGLATEGSYVVSGGEFHTVSNDNVTLNPFRVRLVPPTTQQSSMLKIRVSDNSGIESVAADAEDGVFYDLQGRRVDDPTPGLYIFNGMKVIIK